MGVWCWGPASVATIPAHSRQYAHTRESQNHYRLVCVWGGGTIIEIKLKVSWKIFNKVLFINKLNIEIVGKLMWCKRHKNVSGHAVLAKLTPTAWRVSELMLPPWRWLFFNNNLPQHVLLFFVGFFAFHVVGFFFFFPVFLFFIFLCVLKSLQKHWHSI